MAGRTYGLIDGQARLRDGWTDKIRDVDKKKSHCRMDAQVKICGSFLQEVVNRC